MGFGVYYIPNIFFRDIIVLLSQIIGSRIAILQTISWWYCLVHGIVLLHVTDSHYCLITINWFTYLYNTTTLNLYKKDTQVNLKMYPL